MSMMVSFVLSFFPRDVLDEILNLIESVSEDFPSYSSPFSMMLLQSQLPHGGLVADLLPRAGCSPVQCCLLTCKNISL